MLVCFAPFAFLQLSHRSPAEPESRSFCTELGLSLMQSEKEAGSTPHEVQNKTSPQFLCRICFSFLNGSAVF